ncbi:MAG: class I SAM-dependent methyltransferase [Planctomycetia bacterium]|nr:class I SAM-dependent methyltransferase [Planctomycetia bacterium]
MFLFDARNVLKLPIGYRTFIRAIGGGYRTVYLRDYVRPLAGQRVLDIGCGPGDVVAYLPAVDYVGIDMDERYIRAARSRFGGRGEFRCQSVAGLVVDEPGSYDLVMANGLLHHLNDQQATQLLSMAYRALKPGGRLVTFDGCYVPGQSRLARWLLYLDRGRYVRDSQGYVALAGAAFDHVRSHVRHDLLRIPYTHHIMVCTRLRTVGRGRVHPEVTTAKV